MYGYCYIYPTQVYIRKLTYRDYTVQLEEKLNLVKLSLWIYFGKEYIIILFVSSDDSTRLICG